MLSPLTPISLLLLTALLPATSATPTPNPDPGLLPHIPILDALLALGAAPPPKLLQTALPSPHCAGINGGQLQCCRALVAGDVQLVTWIAMVYGYELNRNDVNGLNCEFSPGYRCCWAVG